MADPTNGNGVRRANTALVMMWVSIGALIINVVGATTFWFALPEKLRNLTAQVESLGLKVAAAEAAQKIQDLRASSQNEVLARVDERTKAMQVDLAQMHQDFSFRANASPR